MCSGAFGGKEMAQTPSSSGFYEYLYCIAPPMGWDASSPQTTCLLRIVELELVLGETVLVKGQLERTCYVFVLVSV